MISSYLWRLRATGAVGMTSTPEKCRVPRTPNFQSEMQYHLRGASPCSRRDSHRSCVCSIQYQCVPYKTVGLASSRSSWSHPESSRPGLTCLLSSVTTACASNHENPAGRQSTSARLDRQEPYVNGLGGGAPGINVLCAWFLIYAGESIVNPNDGDACPNLFDRGNIQQQKLSRLRQWIIPSRRVTTPTLK